MDREITPVTSSRLVFKMFVRMLQGNAERQIALFLHLSLKIWPSRSELSISLSSSTPLSLILSPFSSLIFSVSHSVSPSPLSISQVHFAMNYATILCNIAVGRCLLAAEQHEDKPVNPSSGAAVNQYERQESPQIKSSMEILSSAIKALETHVLASSGGSIEKVDEVNSKLITNAVVVAPVLGRVLGQLGLLYLHPFR